MDIMAIVSEYMVPVIVVICLVVGYVLKNFIKALPNNLIPVIVTVLGVVIAGWVNMGMSPDILAAGLVSGLASTGLHQLLTRTLEKLGGDNNSDNAGSGDVEVPINNDSDENVG